jgi:hypothetical protein
MKIQFFWRLLLYLSFILPDPLYDLFLSENFRIEEIEIANKFEAELGYGD